MLSRIGQLPRCLALGVDIPASPESPPILCAMPRAHRHQIFDLLRPERLGNPRNSGKLRRKLIETAGNEAERDIVAEEASRDRKRRLAARTQDDVEHREIEAFAQAIEGIGDCRGMQNLGIDLTQHDAFEIDRDDGFVFENQYFHDTILGVLTSNVPAGPLVASNVNIFSIFLVIK
ncbi:hypothetical protein [Aurantimonas marianensis]|uniref:Uncharacterized protein n=1 Tax=Aurantimonas marianensis TaxID=2920428 RepID=A0A9X2KEK1_9HYPH|nr:hypothetical protein [Aurantimonas marianensis]MCP3054759.1 hypothetical protein [Aurantimonas marianensis]